MIRAATAALVAQWRSARAVLRRGQLLGRRGRGRRALLLAGVLALSPLATVVHAAPPPARFVERTGAENPVGGITIVDAKSGLTFVDIDADGDFDVFVGNKSEGLRFFENTGSATAPVFEQRTGDANPLVAVPDPSDSPNFADMDGDGDLDAVVAVFSCVDEACDPRIEPYQYYENIGSPSAPDFVLRTDAANPFNQLTFFVGETPELPDLDGDGDFDAISLLENNAVVYYENTGTRTRPIFTQRSAPQSPLTPIERTPTTPRPVDIDGDGDLDLFTSSTDGRIAFYENVGSATAPVFSKQTGAADPFADIANPQNNAPSLVDLDGDGDLDAVLVDTDAATFDPTIRYFENVPDVAVQAGADASEAGTAGSFVIQRLSTAPGGDLVFGYTLGGSAVPGEDYTLVPDANATITATTITLAAGATSATILVVPLDDARNEPDQTVVLTLTAADGVVASPRAAQILLLDDDVSTRMLLPLIFT